MASGSSTGTIAVEIYDTATVLGFWDQKKHIGNDTEAPAAQQDSQPTSQGDMGET